MDRVALLQKWGAIRCPTNGYIAELIGFVWAYYILLFQVAFRTVEPGRVRSIRDADVIRDPLPLVQDISASLGVTMDAEVLEFEVARRSSVHSKALDIDYDATQRNEELRFLRGRYGDDIDRAFRWVQAVHPSLDPIARGQCAPEESIGEEEQRRRA